jgi:hypothetical protein
MTVDEVLALLPRHIRAGGGYLAHCPAHQDRSRSLSVAPGRREGYVLLHCFAGCDRGAILARLGLADEEPPGPAPYIAPPGDEWDSAHRLALQMVRRQPWWKTWATPEVTELRRHRARIDALHRAAERLGPDDPAAWDMLALAAALEHEFRLLAFTEAFADDIA